MNIKLILQAYLACAAWAEELNGNFTKSAIAAAKKDVEKFVLENENEITEFVLQNCVDLSQVGHSFYLSRNGHGAGFFDFVGDAADHLQNSAQKSGHSIAFKQGRWITFI